MSSMMAFVAPPYHPAVPPYATSHSLCQALFISLPPDPHSHTHTPPTIFVLMCCHTLGLPLPPLTPHTTPVGSAGTGSGAASITPALLGPHSWPAASASFRVYRAFIAEVCTSKLTIPSLEHLAGTLLPHRQSTPSTVFGVTPACRSP